MLPASRDGLSCSGCAGLASGKIKCRLRPECKVNARGTPTSPAIVLTTGCHACRAVQPRNAHARCPPSTPGVRHHRLPWTAQARGTHTRGARPSRQLRPLMASNEAVAHPLCRYRLARCHRHPPRRAEILRRSRHRRHPKASAVCASRPCGRPVAAQMQPRLFRHVPRGVRARRSPYAVKADG